MSIAFFMIAGLFGPMIIAFWMMAADPDLRNDLLKRVVVFKTVSPFYLLMTCFLMLAILLARRSLCFSVTAPVSLPCPDNFLFQPVCCRPGFCFFWLRWWKSWPGTPMEPIACADGFPFLQPALYLPFSGPCGIFLSFIKDYYHSNLAETSWIYSLNFSLSLIPYVLLMNWLYYKTGRNIMVAIVFHLTAGFFNEIFATHPDSKVIQTGLLLALSMFLVIKDRDFFFKKRGISGNKSRNQRCRVEITKPAVPVSAASMGSL
ncbi:MAG: hypothetical protein R2861_06800 [Desulfobacterales bacterium]